MNQRTHTWMAIRAVALLDDTSTAPGLVKILKPFVKHTAIGAWIPDMPSSKPGSGDIDNHVLKMKRYKGDQESRFTVAKEDLLKLLGAKRQMYTYLKKDKKLSNAWWGTAYKAEPKPGQHLGNCSMNLSMTLIDMLIFGDSAVAKLVPGVVGFAKNLHKNARSRKEEVATYFFMLSHFIADSCMPCHCDARSLAAYSNGLHKELEQHWSNKIDTFFEKKKLLKANVSSERVLSEAKEVDKEFGIHLPQSIPNLKAGDVWKEVINVCRASFALACIMAPVNTYPLGTRKLAKFDDLFEDNNGNTLLDEMDRVIAHDAILNIAIIWNDIWKTF